MVDSYLHGSNLSPQPHLNSRKRQTLGSHLGTQEQLSVKEWSCKDYEKEQEVAPWSSLASYPGEKEFIDLYVSPCERVWKCSGAELASYRGHCWAGTGQYCSGGGGWFVSRTWCRICLKFRRSVMTQSHRVGFNIKGKTPDPHHATNTD